MFCKTPVHRLSLLSHSVPTPCLQSRARQKYLLACVAERTEQLLRENRQIAALLDTAGYSLLPEQMETTTRTAEAVASEDVSKFIASARAGADSISGLTIPSVNREQVRETASDRGSWFFIPR
jgi:hypothetical protein